MGCFCGCKSRNIRQRHHVVYQQHLRQVDLKGLPYGSRHWGAKNHRSLRDDERNLVVVAYECHQQHHNRSRPYQLAWLPDSVFEFASEVLGPAAAYEYLRRRYAGDDDRLTALLGDERNVA